MATDPAETSPEETDPAEMLGATLDAVAEAALADGMSGDLKEITFTFGDDGSVAVKATPAEGDVYEASMSAEQVAAALDTDVTEDAPAEGEKAPA